MSDIGFVLGRDYSKIVQTLDFPKLSFYANQNMYMAHRLECGVFHRLYVKCYIYVFECKDTRFV